MQTYSLSPFSYDPSWHDDHSLTYLRKCRTTCFLIRVEGVLGTDNTVTTEQGQLGGKVDWQLDRKFVIGYDAGADIKTLEVNDASSSFTNAGQVINRPTVAYNSA